MNSEFFDEGQFPRVALGGGDSSRRLIAFGGSLLLARQDFEAGAASGPHSHDEEQLSLCLSGAFLAEVEGVARRLGPGDSFYAGKGVTHGARCIEAGALLHSFTPQRAEYRKD
ncbi:MAG TPA: cupin domain-containing protein [Rectinemataceae bacterium]|nr:cupin domain-containing protein [Rectinemataceae bacterium]